MSATFGTIEFGGSIFWSQVTVGVFCDFGAGAGVFHSCCLLCCVSPELASSELNECLDVNDWGCYEVIYLLKFFFY